MQHVRWLPLLTIMASILGQIGCSRDDGRSATPASAEVKAAEPPATSGKTHALTIYGYNYTNRYIDQFFVNGQGGANLRVSTPTGGGGGGVCCISWRDGTPLPVKLQVRWVADSCVELRTSREGERFKTVQHIFKEAAVEFKGPVPASPNYLEVHFYPDGKIGVDITNMPSSPHLKLDPARDEPERLCSVNQP